MRRNNDQNALLWALYHEIADKVKPGGVTYSTEQWHLWAKSRFLGCDDVRLPNGKNLLLPKSTADLPVDKFSNYFEQVSAFAADHGVYLADRETV